MDQQDSLDKEIKMNIDENGTPSREFYLFLKYNKIFDKEKNISFSEYEEAMYQEFCRLMKEFISASISEDSTKASTIFGSLTSMFGYNRHYCSITGQPIIGQYYKIGGKIVSKDAYESYKIVLEMEKKHTQEEKNKKESIPPTHKTQNKKQQKN